MSMKAGSELRKLCLFYAILFLMGGIAFILLPQLVIKLINELGSFQTVFTSLKASTDRFWVVLTFSMMMMISYASFMISQGKHVQAFVSILLLSKFCSSATYLILLFTEQMAFAYFVGFVTDGVIFLSILLLRQKPELSY